MATSRAETLENKPNLPKELPLDFFKKITDDFSDQRLLGTGSFGSVYKGILEDGGAVAVKKLRLDWRVPPKKIFANVVQNIIKLEHENVVKLVSFCGESPMNSSTAGITEIVLCYDYFPKGSLDKHIFDASNPMDWNTHFDIIKGICEGIQYLHSLSSPLLHLGLKPQNILLDGNMVPKIADFVFSRNLRANQLRRRTHCHVGSVGYIAPESEGGREVSAQSDIYGLGLVILEIVTGEKNSSSSIDQRHAIQYIDHVKKNWTEEKIMSEYPELDEDGLSQVEACIEIGLQCVLPDQYDRPSIKGIIKKLSGQ